MGLHARIEAAISSATGETARFAQSRAAPGGSINSVSVVTLTDGREVFVKTHDGPSVPAVMFAAEFEALARLAAPGVIRVPQPIAFDEE